METMAVDLDTMVRKPLAQTRAVFVRLGAAPNSSFGSEAVAAVQAMAMHCFLAGRREV